MAEVSQGVIVDAPNANGAQALLSFERWRRVNDATIL
jgi:hypothetical protein